MRIRLSLLALLAPCVAAATDLVPGTIAISGSARLTYSSQKASAPGASDLTSDTTEFALGGLYYVWKNVGLGLSATYQRATTQQASFEVRSSSWLIGPQVGADLALGENVGLFAVATAGWARASAQSVTMGGWGWGAGGGLRYFLSRAASIDASISYLALDLSGDGAKLDTSGFTVGAGLTVYFGGGR